MPTASTLVLSAAATSSPIRKTAMAAEKKYKCQFCSRAFSRSEHRSRHERSHTKERPFKCGKCRSTFVRRDLLLRHDRTVHAKDGGAPLHAEVKRRSGPKTSPQEDDPSGLDGVEATNDDPIDAMGEDMGDLEAAAMLMTGFHHKAMASQESDIHEEHELPSITHSLPTLLEPPINYHSSQMSLPQMPWDSLQAHPSSDPNTQVFSNNTSFQRASASFSSTGMGHSHHDHLSSMMDHGSLTAEGLQALGGAVTLSGMATPGALSPFPSMLGPVSPVDYRRSPGPSQALTMAKPPQVEAEDQCARILENIKKCDSEVALLETFRLPNRSVLNRYLSTYFNLFHHHLPFLHPASFKPTEVAAPLLLAVLSIGALYTFEQDQAFMLHIGSKVLVNQFLQKKNNFSSRKCPLWTMQATLLNMFFATWSGDPKGLEWACSIKGLLANMVAGNRWELKIRSDAREGRQPTHEEWIEEEGCRRSYYAVYVYFGMLTLTFNHTPAISFNEFDSLDLPSSESLWTLEASDEESWRESITASTISTFREAHKNLFEGTLARYSAFGTRVMITALFLEVWNHMRSPEPLQDIVTDFKLRLALETWEKSLELCEPETVVVQLSAPHRGHPLIFNALAVYRNTKVRLLVDLRSIQEALRYHEPFEVAAAMTNARDKVKRSAEMIKVIQECFDCIEVAAVQGIRWVARTSATNWSVEHPLCGLDLIVILSLWLWQIEHDDEPATDEELAMYNRLRNLFDDDSVDVYGSKLSATVARLWGSMIDEVVVWGITKLIGDSFKLHAQALSSYDDSAVANNQNARKIPNTKPPVVEALEMQTAY